MKIKPIFRYDYIQGKFRLFRLLWNRGTAGDGSGYSAALTVAICRPRIKFWREDSGWGFNFLGLQVIRHRSYGGIFT